MQDQIDQLMDYVKSQFQQIEGELYIEQAIIAEIDEKLKTLTEKNNVLGHSDLMGFVKSVAELKAYQDIYREKLMKLDYLRGKFDSYMTLITQIENIFKK